MMRTFISVLTFVLFCGFASANAALPEKNITLSEKEVISQLVEFIGSSEVVFIRNGSKYTAEEAQKHVSKKLRYAGDRIKTAHDFIEGICSRSYMSGKPYFVKLPTGKVIESRRWIMHKLANIRSKA